MKATYFGTTTLLFDDGTDQILFDAHLTRPSLVKYLLGSCSTDTEMADELMEKHPMDRLRAIFISHTHHDHVLDMPYIAEKSGAKIYGSSSALNVARGGNIDESRLIGFEAGQSYAVGDFSVKVLKSLHSKPTVFNNDLGKTIDEPLRQPAKLRSYAEGGSYDFYVENRGKKYLIRPSFNYIEGQLDGYEADVLFLGVAGLAKADAETEKRFFEETVEKVKPELVIPLHWDNFFVPLSGPAYRMYRVIEKNEEALFRLVKYCEDRGLDCIVQLPRTSVEI